jgi:proline iminopeptidase
MEFNVDSDSSSARSALRPGARGRSAPRSATEPIEGDSGYHVATAGTRLFVRELGEGPPVVVLHGGPGAHHDYLLPYFAWLADEFHLFLYDQRGGGRSRVRRPTTIGWRDHVADLETLRREWELDRPALLGYSWGGLLALLYAADHSAHVGALALVAPAAAWGDYQHRFKHEFERRSHSPEVERMRRELEDSHLESRDPRAYRQRRFDLSVAGYFKDPRKARDLTPFKVQAQAQHHTWASLGGQGPELRRKLVSLRVPTLILHGRHDPIPLEWAEELASVLPTARLHVLEESGHVPYVEQPEETFSTIREFLSREMAG